MWKCNLCNKEIVATYRVDKIYSINKDKHKTLKREIPFNLILECEHCRRVSVINDEKYFKSKLEKMATWED